MQTEFNKNEADFLDFVNDIQGYTASGDEIEIKALIDEIAKYNVFDFIARIASLNLLIENQNKSILFDALIAGLLTRERTAYPGTAKMSSGKFRSIVNRLENLNLRYMIDPTENAFIERVCYYGNHWIFPGINYSPSYSLQGYLNVLCLSHLQFDPDFTQKAHQLINFVLQISDSIVQALGYGLDSICHVEQSSIRIPPAVLAEKAKSCVCWDYSLIEAMIPDESLRQSLFIEFENHELTQVINGQWQDFFMHPFLKTETGAVIILNPTILVSFVIQRLVLLADSYGTKEQLVDAYNNEIWRKCKKDLKNLGHKKIQEGAYGITLVNNRYRKEVILTVGNNQLLFVQFVCDAGDDYDSRSMFGNQKIDADVPSTHDRAEYFVSKLPFANWENVYQIVILNSFGRMISSKITEGERNFSIHLSPFELHCIAVNEQNRNEFLPRYINAKKKIELSPVTVIGSELNSVEIYTSNDYSFYLSDDFDPANTSVFFGFGDSLDYVIRAIKKEDRHLIESYDGKHLVEVILGDSERKIYYTEGSVNKPPALVVKFGKLNIWLTTDRIENSDESNVCFSIIDAISYWLAEARMIIDDMDLYHNTICLQVSLIPPIEQYYSTPERDAEFGDCIHYEYVENSIRMIWQPIAYQLLSDKSNNTEKAMIKSIIGALEKLSTKPANLETLDGIFSNPLKKKVFEIDIANIPYLAPTTGSVRTISAEEENQLLDEIGKHFLTLPDYGYGKVPGDKRAELANQVVSYLYSLLQTEVASIMPAGVYEQVCFDLETVMYHAMLLQTRFAYDISCYPEKIDRIMDQYNKVNQASVALKFFAEYIAATPPSGDRPLGSMQYDRILAICSLIVNWAYKNDLFRYNIFNTPVEFLKSGRIGMSRTENDYLSSINTAAMNRRLESTSDPRILRYSPANLLGDFQERIDDAFVDEYGFTFQQFAQCVMEIANYGDEITADVKRFKRNTVSEVVTKRTEIAVDLVEKIIDRITLCQREDFLVPPEPYRKYDVYPWRFNRELSFTRRPIIQYNDDLIWGNRQLHHMLRFTIDLIMNGKYQARRPKLKQLIGKLSDKRGNDFNAAVVQKLSSIDGLIVCGKLSKINGKKIADGNQNVLGDIDVFYIIPDKKEIVVGEVKDFSFAKNPYEMAQEYKRVFVDEDKPCYMTKHKRRAAWVKEHLDDVKTHFNLSDGKWSVKTVMFVSEEIISNTFYHQEERIIVYSDISAEKIKSV